MTRCVFASDLHGHIGRYRELFRIVALEQPVAVFLGGDLLPSMSPLHAQHAHDFLRDFLRSELFRLRDAMTVAYPPLYLIMGNDDARAEEPVVQELHDEGLVHYIHNRRAEFSPFQVYGYSYVPPTPFLLKDWERYDLSRYLGPGDVPPEEGIRSTPVDEYEIRHATIKSDLDQLTGGTSLEHAVMLFHAPPYQTHLDRCALDGIRMDGVPLDPHVGSIAIRRFIEDHQPLLTLHGHIHESARLTGSWRDQIGRTRLFSAAHDGDELAVIRFDLEDLEGADRCLFPLPA